MDLSQKKGQLIFMDQTFTHEDFRSDVISFSKQLSNYGLKHGDRVILRCSNTYSFCVSLFSLMHIDCSIVLLDIETKESDTNKILLKTNAKWLLAEEDFENQIGYKHIKISTIMKESLYKKTFYKNEPICLDSWFNRSDAVILFSSGSTGIPKGMVKSGSSLFNNMHSTAIGMRYRKDDVILPIVPFFNIWGFNLIIQWWVVGCTLVICNYRTTRTISSLIEKNKVSVVEATIATTYLTLQLIDRKLENKSKICKSLRMWYTSGAPVPQTLKNRFHEVINLPLLDYYGSSEAGNLTATNLQSTNGTGKLLPGSSVKVFNEKFEELGFGEVGHVYAKGNGLMEGYLIENNKIELSLKNGWFDMKDFGFFDEEGNLFILGRRDNAIHRMGATFFPCHMERLVEELGVMSKVVSFPDDKKGSHLILFVQSPQDNSAFIRKKVLEVVPTYMYPDEFFCLNEFPFLPNGKVDNKQLESIVNKNYSLV
ncbi:class I adenylate-forming enzyme family protein [Peribacillus simplex]|uniref:class I adenylate-forming enzyme family protein n=1 Tax=Peribacillus simplex TaxID=1478 RepID=UPI003D29A5A0